MKQLTNKQHLVFMLENAHLVTSLPFIDMELDNYIPKSKVAYLIKSEQDQMNVSPMDYIVNLHEPKLNYANSLEFQRQVERVQNKFASKDKTAKKEEIVFPEIAKKVTANHLPKITEQVRKGILSYEHLVSKNLNLQLFKKYGPLILKEMIEILQKQKGNLQTAIQRQKQKIEQVNKNRKYNQQETYQRESDINERIKIMVNKRRKLD